MIGEANIRRRRPILVTEDYLRKIDEVARTSVDRAISQKIISAGFNPNEIKGIEDLEKLENYDRNFQARQLAGEIQSFEAPRWRVKLKNNLDIKSITLPELLALPNAGDRVFREVSMSAGKWGSGISCDLDADADSGGVNFKISGDIDTVQWAKTEMEALASDMTRPWWPLRSTSFLFFSFSCFTLLTWTAIGIGVYVIENGSIEGGASLSFRFLFTGMAVLSAPFILAATRQWSRIFPSAEFMVGSGAQRESFNSKIRTFLLFGAPGSLLIIPLIGKFFA